MVIQSATEIENAYFMYSTQDLWVLRAHPLPLGAADFVASFCCCFRGVYGETLGYWQAVFSEQLLTLILVKIHAYYRLR
jgi:hypothetical protein